MSIRTRFLVAILLPSAYLAAAAAFLCACTGTVPSRMSYKQPDPDFDRTGFGNAPFPFWFALTPAEVPALSAREAAVDGDADALLGFAIFASGDLRQPAEYQAIRERVRAFVAKEKPGIDAEKTAYRKGFRLHKAMHEAFFPPQGNEGELRGYEWSRSDFTGIFRDGKYNCVSSAILYVVLARHFGLDAEGVILTSHAFAQLRTPEGKVIEVETTTPTGFDWVHDDAFYRKRAGPWFSVRGLPASSYADYQARAVVEPLQLISHNMNNQHTMPGRMDAEARLRLIEGRAWADAAWLAGKDGGSKAVGKPAGKPGEGSRPGADRQGQLNRLDLYNSEFAWLWKRKDHATLERMFRKVLPSIPAVKQAWPADGELANHASWLPFEYARVLVESGRPLEALPWIDSSLAWLRPESSQGIELRRNNVAVLLGINQDLARQNRFEDAERLLARYPRLAADEPTLKAGTAWLYHNWAVEAWNKGEWEVAVSRFDKQVAVAERNAQPAILDNMASAYLNWAGTFEKQGDWSRTAEILRLCSNRLPESKKCRATLDRFTAEHRME